jgi:hypothetical protein
MSSEFKDTASEQLQMGSKPVERGRRNDGNSL